MILSLKWRENKVQLEQNFLVEKCMQLFFSVFNLDLCLSCALLSLAVEGGADAIISSVENNGFLEQKRYGHFPMVKSFSRHKFLPSFRRIIRKAIHHHFRMCVLSLLLWWSRLLLWSKAEDITDDKKVYIVMKIRAASDCSSTCVV